MQKVWYTVGGALVAPLIAALMPGPLGILMTGLSVLLGAAIGFLIALILIARSRGEDPSKVVAEAVQQATQPDPGALERPVHEGLAQSNLDLRLDGNVSDKLIATVEKLIDQVRQLIPKALQDSSGSEMTYNIERLGAEYLPKYISSFLATALEDRDAKEEELQETLSDIAAKLTKAEEHLDQGRLHEFEAESGFMGMKFSN